MWMIHSGCMANILCSVLYYKRTQVPWIPFAVHWVLLCGWNIHHYVCLLDTVQSQKRDILLVCMLWLNIRRSKKSKEIPNHMCEKEREGANWEWTIIKNKNIGTAVGTMLELWMKWAGEQIKTIQMWVYLVD